MQRSSEYRLSRPRTFLVLIAAATVAASLTTSSRADGPKDNIATNVRPIPPAGVEIPAADRKELEAGVKDLEAALQPLQNPGGDRLADVQIFVKAVDWALRYNEFQDVHEVAKAKALLKEGRERAEQLAAGKTPWANASGLVVRGYVSKIDGSVQPYGLVVPENIGDKNSGRHPLDIWFHGRNEAYTELNFIDERNHSRGQFTPPNTIVLHPYGRYCNASKFAGETDLFEAIKSVSERYAIDPNRICVRGFSMGGASTWHTAVHFAGQWCAANPGAGFAETPEFLRIFQNEVIHPTPYEEKLLHWYDSTDWAGNLFNCPTVAYSGEIDTQKQAADMMQKAMEREGLKLTYIIGPNTKHAYHPESAKIVGQLMADLVAKGRNEIPREVHFTTYTLKYNTQDWIIVDALQEHWKRADVVAKITATNTIEITTKNVAGFSIAIPTGESPERIDLSKPVTVTIDGEKLEFGKSPAPDFIYNRPFHRDADGKWVYGVYAAEADEGSFKQHDHQGPIDDAFMDSFIFVRPTGHSKNPKFDAWAKSEMERAIREWRRQFRGDPRVADDKDIQGCDCIMYNLVLWGDPTSNSVLHRMADKLPIQWGNKEIAVGNRKFPADNHALVMIYPNPLNPLRYVVLNSGFTYREYDYLNNARQVAKLPDWAVVNLDTPPDTQKPGKIVAADFFDEFWKLKK